MGYHPWGRKDLKQLGMHAIFYYTHTYGYSILYLCLYITQSPAKGHLGCSYISATRMTNRAAIILNQTYFTSWNLHITLSSALSPSLFASLTSSCSLDHCFHLKNLLQPLLAQDSLCCTASCASGLLTITTHYHSCVPPRPFTSKLPEGRGHGRWLTITSSVPGTVHSTDTRQQGASLKPCSVHAAEWSKRQKECRAEKKITLQTSKLIYKCKELGVMKKSLKVQEESVSIL